MNNFDAIYRILHHLDVAMDRLEPDMDFISAKAMGITENRWNAIMEMLISSGYIEGIISVRFESGSVMILGDSPRITIKGLEYLAENSLMKKAEEMANGFVKIIK